MSLVKMTQFIILADRWLAITQNITVFSLNININILNSDQKPVRHEGATYWVISSTLKKWLKAACCTFILSFKLWLYSKMFCINFFFNCSVPLSGKGLRNSLPLSVPSASFLYFLSKLSRSSRQRFLSLRRRHPSGGEHQMEAVVSAGGYV